MPADKDRAKYDCLWRSLGLAGMPVGDWRELPPPEAMPSPWIVWTLIGLVRHRRRQLWVGEIVTARLGGDMGQLAACGALGHPESRPQSGPVPGLPEWEYFFHGKGCRLTHRVTGEEIDVDFFGDDAELIDLYFYCEFLRSLRKPEQPEQRLIELHPSLESIQLGCDQLCESGLLLADSKHRTPKLSPDLLAQERGIIDFCVAWEEPHRRMWLAGLLGDWPLVEVLAHPKVDPHLAQLAAERAAECRRERLKQLAGVAEREPRLVLLAVSDLNAPVLPNLLRRVLQGPITSTTAAAMEIIEKCEDAREWCPAVYAFFERLDPDGAPGTPHPVLWVKCAYFLLRHGHRAEEVVAMLPHAGSHVIGDASLIALEYAPAAALGLFRRALRSQVPANRGTAAAVLALIDQPWSRAELMAVLRESDDQEMTVECRAALAESRDPQVRQTALDWEGRNPHEPEVGRFISMGEMALRHAPEYLRCEMEHLRDRVIPLCQRAPTES